MTVLVKNTAVTLLVAAALFLIGCQQGNPVATGVSSNADEIRPFVNVTQSALKGLQESWNIRPGVVIFDYDRDGDMDFYVSNAYEFGNWLYRNNGDGTFDNVADDAGAALRQTHGTGVVACDVNNDGYQDLYVGAQGSITDRLDYRSQPEGDQNIDRLLLNDGDGTFTDITMSAFWRCRQRALRHERHLR